jgi:[glutamine synthetase] adenylyltransferase / [glutamine synthetase]-adenylyl-L-tyrosine phosphorylase
MNENTPVINEPKKDSFTLFKKDPRLNTSVYQLASKKKSQDLRVDLSQEFSQYKDDENFFDAIRQYKTEQKNRIINELESSPLQNRPRILKALSTLADSILFVTYERVFQIMKAKHGMPCFLSSYKQTVPANLAILGMGKLGGQEINYYSDLDIIFVYSHRGETLSSPAMDNRQFFVKLAQKYINVLSVMTSAGRCYEIDTELRPSGNAGALVISYDHFLDHQMNKAQTWERYALLRARAMASSWEFQDQLDKQINKLTYQYIVNKDIIPHMHKIRKQVIKERAAQETNGFDIKLGEGGLMDIEFIAHLIQLKYGLIHPNLQQRSLFELFDALKKHDILSVSERTTLSQAHLYFRSIESLLHLDKKRSDSFLQFDTSLSELITEKLNLTSVKEYIKDLREDVRKIYKRFYLLS